MDLLNPRNNAGTLYQYEGHRSYSGDWECMGQRIYQSEDVENVWAYNPGGVITRDW